MGIGAILEIAVALGLPLVKWIAGLIMKKKLSDKEFLEFIRAQQLKVKGAGQTAMSWEEYLAKAKKELEAMKLEDKNGAP